ncbi:hypothetical protein DCAR_0935300 [Daucus carota subsp. sativus]|uniref:Peptidase metallopeptidase domain-containing protein n=1 Tax=Daucus carota subsp. sativus TaxID=79200 RepID=A0A175YGK9_DAUCS|nr:PREDICTED: metalloendoproteinase 1-like [Daucus carota subsp. sativus]WOH15756.1 hypothetical protein DCAR_0935300 [Daucus carota subsp. sativus]
MAQHFKLISCISLFLLLLVPSNAEKPTHKKPLLPSKYENLEIKKPLIVSSNSENPKLLHAPSNSENLATKKPQPFGFLNHLKGGKKGENLAGIRELKKYLNKFGYLNYKSINGHDNDHFDEMLEAAVKTYQANYNLKITGILDSETISKMVMPRCGFPDIINGTNSMTKKHEGHQHHGSNKLHIVAHYSYGSYKWPAGKTHLYYWFETHITYSSIKRAVARAFNRWASYTQHFTFEETLDYQSSDLTVTYYRGDHGDGSAFDGPGGVLAHAFFPTDGRLHFDVDERWSIGAIPNYIDLESVAVHEIGHLLGLAHSTVQDAIMYPSLPYGVVKTNLQPDDIQGIKALYNI